MDSLYSAFIVEAGNSNPNRELFTYQRSERVPMTDVVATNVHTNMPRNGEYGLPMGWHFRVTQWRANTNQRYLDGVLEYASEVSLNLMYMGRSIAQTPMIDLLFSPHPLRWPYSLEENHMSYGRREILQDDSSLLLRENIGFRVEYQCTSQKAHNTFETWLVENCVSGRLMGWVWLEGQLTCE